MNGGGFKMAKKSRGGRMTAAKTRAAKRPGGKAVATLIEFDKLHALNEAASQPVAATQQPQEK